MKLTRRKVLWAAPRPPSAWPSLTACGGNLGTQSSEEAAAAFPDGPVTSTIGQDPGGSTDLIGRALADPVSEKLGVPVPVVNKPGANGALAAKELASKPPNGQDLMVINISLVAITPLAVPEDQAVDINNYEVITGISQDDYVLMSNAESGLKTVDDLKNAGETLELRHHRRRHRQPAVQRAAVQAGRDPGHGPCRSTAARRR